MWQCAGQRSSSGAAGGSCGHSTGAAAGEQGEGAGAGGML